MQRPAATILLLPLLACACGDDAVEIPDGVHPFDGTDVALPREDLDALWDLVGDARIIGLGEVVHTSGGFYAAKNRLVRALIEDRGVRTIAWEAPRSLARELDGYLVSGDCDRPAEEVLLPIPKVFSDDNTYALVRWICERNAATPSDPVRLFGFDIKQDGDHADIQAFLEAWAGDAAAELLAGLETCFAEYDGPLPTVAEHDSCLEGIDVLEGWGADEEAALIASAGERAVGELRASAIGFRAWQGYNVFYETDLGRSWEARDVGMGRVFEVMMGLDVAPGGRVAVWAADVHLSSGHDEVTQGEFAGKRSFGTVVADTFGDDYAPIAFIGYGPGMNWDGVIYARHTDVGTAVGSVEDRLHDLGQPALIVDPRAAFLEPEAEHMLGHEWMVAKDQFRALLYLDESPPMNAVYW